MPEEKKKKTECADDPFLLSKANEICNASDHIDEYPSSPIQTSKDFIEGTPYINLGKPIEDLTPKEFKESYKGVYSNLFKFVKDRHNIDLGIMTRDGLTKLIRKMNYYGIIYNFTQIKDGEGNDIHYGPSWVKDDKKVIAGFHRIGRAINIEDRKTLYKREKTGKHFENTFQKLGPRAFNFNFLAVCKNEQEYKATEYFWQLYFNREENEDGYDLRNNGNFNNRLGSMYDNISNLILPKYYLVRDILYGLDKFELDERYKNLKGIISVKQALIHNFGIESIFKIRAMLVAPLLDYNLKRGLTEQENIEKLIESGFGMFDKNLIQERSREYGPSSTRTNPKNLFQRILVYTYGPPRIRPSRVFTHYEQLRKENFFEPFIEYLKDLNIAEIIGESQNDQNTLSIVDYLFEKCLSPTYIVKYLGYKGSEAELLINKINNYLNRRWRPLIEQFSWDKLRLFLKFHPLIISTHKVYSKYL
ncbi:MAG: hypothetical protein ACFE8A_08170 [Candidatus Hodarchaeota archaeon]